MKTDCLTSPTSTIHWIPGPARGGTGLPRPRTKYLFAIPINHPGTVSAGYMLGISSVDPSDGTFRNDYFSSLYRWPEVAWYAAVDDVRPPDGGEGLPGEDSSRRE